LKTLKKKESTKAESVIEENKESIEPAPQEWRSQRSMGDQ